MIKNKSVEILLAILVGVIGIHRLWLFSRSGIIFIPVLFTGIALVDSQFILLHYLGLGIIISIIIRVVLDIYLIITDKFIYITSNSSRFKFILTGILYACLIWAIIGTILIIFNIVPVPRA